jgi:hypothetical protein
MIAWRTCTFKSTPAALAGLADPQTEGAPGLVHSAMENAR